MNTTPEQRQDWIDAIMERGEIPQEADILDLIQDASTAEYMDAAIDAIQRAVHEAGMVLVDVTTDDDDEARFMLAPMEE